MVEDTLKLAVYISNMLISFGLTAVFVMSARKSKVPSMQRTYAILAFSSITFFVFTGLEVAGVAPEFYWDVLHGGMEFVLLLTLLSAFRNLYEKTEMFEKLEPLLQKKQKQKGEIAV
jgi:hypothetical protein